MQDGIEFMDVFQQNNPRHNSGKKIGTNSFCRFFS